MTVWYVQRKDDPLGQLDNSLTSEHCSTSLVWGDSAAQNPEPNMPCAPSSRSAVLLITMAFADWSTVSHCWQLSADLHAAENTMPALFAPHQCKIMIHC